MKTTILILILTVSILTAQSIPDLPIPIGAGTAEVWNDSIFYFGGADSWNGQNRYPHVYKYDGQQWSYSDSIPDDMVWSIKSVIVGNEVYLLGGWPGGAQLLRKYNLSNRTWIYLPSSPNSANWGNTTEYLNGNIYLFNPNANVYAYNINDSTWTTKTPNTTLGTFGLSSAIYQDEIYITGFIYNQFFKYTPATDQWIQLADIPIPVSSSAMGIIDNKLYCVGGSGNGSPQNVYKDCWVYDFTLNSWYREQFEISDKRHWMATVQYQNVMYVVGGLDSSAVAVDIVEEILPQGISGIEISNNQPAQYSLEQNHPNPFNPSTIIRYHLHSTSHIELVIYNSLGQKVQSLVNTKQQNGEYSIKWDGTTFANGVYYYRLKAGNYIQTKKMMLLR